MNSASLALAVGMAVLLGASLPGKLRSPNSEPRPPTETPLAAALTAHGWRLEVAVSGLYDLASWRGPDCGGVLVSGFVPANGEAAAVMAKIAGNDGEVLYLQDGRVLSRLSQPTAYLKAKLGPLLHRLGLGSDPSAGAVTAVAITAECRHSVALPFRGLERR